MTEEEEYMGKKEIDIHRFRILSLEKTDSIPFLLETYYNNAIRQTLTIIMVLLLLLGLVLAL